MTIFSMKRLFVTQYNQQGLVNWTMLLADFGLAFILITLSIFLGWRLFDLFKQNGLWTKEFKNPDLGINKTSPVASVPSVEEEIR
jgi:hypothetical protein